MAKDSKISWTHHTFNIAWGCAKVSEACRSCDAETWAARTGNNGLWGIGAKRRVLSEDNWRQPLKWNKAAEKAGERHRVFCSSMADVFEDHPTVAAERLKLWPLIEATPRLDWLLLTKRPENMVAFAPASWAKAWPSNVWAGTTVENQKRADERIPHLLRVPAAVRFLSMEPLLEAVNLSEYIKPTLVCLACEWSGGLEEKVPSPDGYHWGADTCPDCKQDGNMITLWGDWQVQEWRDGERYASDTLRDGPQIHWVIAGGESGTRARAIHPAWIRSLRDQSIEAGIDFHFKQWGEFGPGHGPPPRVVACADGTVGEPGDVEMVRRESFNLAAGTSSILSRHGVKNSGRTIDGREWDEVPSIEAPAPEKSNGNESEERDI